MMLLKKQRVLQIFNWLRVLCVLSVFVFHLPVFANNLSFDESDQVNSTKLVLNDDGAPVKYFEYTAYGEEFITEGDEKHSPTYGSHQKDKESCRVQK